MIVKINQEVEQRSVHEIIRSMYLIIDRFDKVTKFRLRHQVKVNQMVADIFR